MCVASRCIVELKTKIQQALDESRMLVLGLQVLLGFTFQAFLMPKLDRLPPPARTVEMFSLAAMLVALVLLYVPTAHHRIVDRGEDSFALDSLSRKAMCLALAPLALSLAGEMFVVGLAADGRALGTTLGLIGGLAALAGFYVVPLLMRRAVGPVRQRASSEEEPKTKLDVKIRQVLTEARVVLPGTQALLGFQLAGVLQSGFDSLPPSSKILHVVALLFLAASVILLMMPAAYHRLTLGGEINEQLHRFASVCIVLSMVALLVALGCDTLIVVRRATGNTVLAVAAASLWTMFSVGAWLLVPFVLRFLRDRRLSPRSRTLQKHDICDVY